jgi:ATP:ADP antiporter, AAA family
MVARLILLSFLIGLYISYFLSFISAVFIKSAGIKNLPLAYILAGIGGTLFTRFFQKAEISLGFFKATLVFLLQIALLALSLSALFENSDQNNTLIFLSYVWFWISGNFLLLVFWKIPSKIFDLETNKKTNPLISSGEVISALIAYLSVPLLLSSGLIASPTYLLLMAGISGVLIIIVFSSLKMKNEAPGSLDIRKTSFSFFELLKKPFFFAILSVMLVSFSVRFIADYLALQANSVLFQDTKQLASFLALMFGAAKLLEFLLKITITGRLFKTYGISAGLISIALVLLFTSGISLLGLLFGALTFSLILAILNKVLERSLTSAVYTPAHNILYHAFPADLKSLAQNYSDGYGKTYGQLFAGLLILGISLIPNTRFEMITLLIVQILLLWGWYKIGLKLIGFYKNGLKERILGEFTNNETKKSGSKEYYDSLTRIFQTFASKYDAIEDLANPKYHVVTDYLNQEIDQLTPKIFDTLLEKYEEKTIRSIEKQLTGEQVIAFELLELLLNDQEKSLVLPVLKRLNPEDHTHHTQFNERIRLFSLAHDPYNSIEVRKIALDVYAKNFGNQDHLISGLVHCPEPAIKTYASELLKKLQHSSN